MNAFSPAARAVIVAAAAAILVLAVREASSVVTPILLALVIAVIWSAFPAWLRSRGITGYWTVLATIASVVAVFALLGLIVAVYLIRIDERLPVYQERLDEIQIDIEDFVNDLGISDEPVDISGVFADEVFSAERVTSLARTALEGIFSAAGLGSIIFLFALFMLAESRDWSRKFALLPTTETDIAPHITQFAQDIRRWLLITLGTGAMVAVPSTIALMLFQVDFAVLWGILILIMSFVPSIGFIISVIPPVGLAWILHGPWTALSVLVVIVVINTVVDNFIKPRIVGRSLNMSPLVLIIGVVFWSWVLGPMGAFLSMPLTLLVRFGLQTHPETEWLARMMGSGFDEPEPETAPETAGAGAASD